jgi:hypothetical protein
MLTRGPIADYLYLVVCNAALTLFHLAGLPLLPIESDCENGGTVGGFLTNVTIALIEARRESMSRRSESVNRTVVDLSLSFVIAVIFTTTNRRVVANEH